MIRISKTNDHKQFHDKNIIHNTSIDQTGIVDFIQKIKLYEGVC